MNTSRNLSSFDICPPCLTPQGIQVAISFARSKINGIPKQQILVNGEHVVILNELGSGGTKVVYDAIVGGKRIALALCRAKNSKEMFQRWSEVVQEPSNTKRIRDLGLYANTFCIVHKLEIDGVAFPCLLMTRYSDLPFIVCDRKNASNNTNPVLETTEEINDETMMSILSKALDEIVTLLRNHIGLNSDSVNLCITQDNKIHIFVMDVPKIDQIDTDNILDWIGLYISHLLGAVMQSVRWETFAKSGYIKSLDSNNRLKQKMRDYIITRLKGGVTML